MNVSSRMLIPVFIVFAVLNILIFAFKSYLESKQINISVLLVANAFFMLLSVIVFFLQKKALRNPNPNVFVRSVMSGMMIKMVLCVIAVLIYTLSAGDQFNKRSVFIALFLYLFYLAAEVKSLTKLNQQNG
jgi:hypothetical protein